MWIGFQNMINLNQFMWVEKYRPKTVDECIFTKDIKDYFKSLVSGKEIPNLLLSGGAGCGKTTIAKALCEELETDWLFINGSDDSGIDTLRSKIKDFAVSRSLTGNTKVVIIDEADYLNPNSFQPAFRSFLEIYSSNCRFILTCNNKNKLIKPIRSRLTNIEFKISPDENPVLAGQFFKRVLYILKQENVTASPEVIAGIIGKYFPDFRKTIVELQRNVKDGKISDKILSSSIDVNVDDLKKILKDKDWKAMRQWVSNNVADYDVNDLFRLVYDGLVDFTNDGPHLVLIIGNWQHKAAFSPDQEINFAAFLTEVMTTCEFK